jgi:catechol 2,3-dioxygenase-like lactoylglutathione lyase family enzyme
MATVRGLDHVYYWTADMERAVRFYRDVLGLRLLRREGDSWALFDAAGPRFALHGLVEGHAVSSGGATAVFEVEDLDGARLALEGRGVRFHDRAGEVAGYARFASFSDPDGNTVQVIEYLGGGRPTASA